MRSSKRKLWSVLIAVMAILAVGAIPTGIYYVSQRNKQTRYADALRLAKLLGASESDVISTTDRCDAAVCIRKVYFRTDIGREDFVTKLKEKWPPGGLLISESRQYLDQTSDGSILLGPKRLEASASNVVANEMVLLATGFCEEISADARSESTDRSLCYFGYFAIRDGGYSFKLDASTFADDVLIVQLQS
jgi:hypothetical protein